MKEMIPLSVGAAASGLLYREHSMRTKAERLSAATLEALLNTIDANDETTGSHVRRVAAYALILAEAAGYDERKRVLSRPTLDLRAYTLFLKGRQHYIRFTSESIAQAIDYFERAIATDANFALAHATLAMACIEQAELGAYSPDRVATGCTSTAACAPCVCSKSLGAHSSISMASMSSNRCWLLPNN